MEVIEPPITGHIRLTSSQVCEGQLTGLLFNNLMQGGLIGIQTNSRAALKAAVMQLYSSSNTPFSMNG